MELRFNYRIGIMHKSKLDNEQKKKKRNPIKYMFTFLICTKVAIMSHGLKVRSIKIKKFLSCFYLMTELQVQRRLLSHLFNTCIVLEDAFYKQKVFTKSIGRMWKTGSHFVLLKWSMFSIKKKEKEKEKWSMCR